MQQVLQTPTGRLMRSNINIRPITPVHGTFEPGPDTSVHYMSPVGRVICGVRGPAHRVKSRLLGNVTCPACLKLLNLHAPSQQPSCGATAGSTTLSAESAMTAREKTDNTVISSFGGSPASDSSGAGFLLGNVVGDDV